MTIQKSNAQIVQAHSKTVYRLAYAMLQNRSDADDVYQEVFLRYVKRQPVFNDAGHEKAWFIRVTSNCAKSFACAPFRKRTQQLTDDCDSYCMDEQSIQLRELVNRLEPKYRLVIHLFYYEDMAVKKMSEVLGIKQTTIRSQLMRAREILKGCAKGDVYEF